MPWRLLLSLVPALAAASGAAAQALSPAEIVAAAPESAWVEVPPEDLLVFDFDGGRRIVVAMAPQAAPTHVANIRRLVADGWFARHAAIVRVQENYVVQWGDPTDKAELPTGLAKARDGYEQPGIPQAFRALPFPDAYGARVGHARGWAIATDGTAHWLPHCPEMVGVGRDMPPDTGSGAELYAVIGHGPRHLDRNIALVGRVVLGMELLSSLPRGSGPLGFYESGAERIPVRSARFAESLPPGERPRLALLATNSDSFAAWVEARANRRDAFCVRPAGSADICNLLPPARRLMQPE
ncbi:MAG: peptidylprolyl isomerase [Sphingomonadaceae bacterium]